MINGILPLRDGHKCNMKGQKSKVKESRDVKREMAEFIDN